MDVHFSSTFNPLRLHKIHTQIVQQIESMIDVTNLINVSHQFI